MTIKRIEELLRVFNRADLTVLELCEDTDKIRFEKQPSPKYASPAFIEPKLQRAYFSPDEIVRVTKASTVVDGVNNYLKSPLKGIFHSAKKFDSAPLISLGDAVKKGQVVCLIKSIDGTQEITTDKDGEIAEICVASGQLVEYGQPLFRLV